jgi:hypothetical protein
VKLTVYHTRLGDTITSHFEGANEHIVVEMRKPIVKSHMRIEPATTGEMVLPDFSNYREHR